jgi:pimeloyl-ACP methyl ester carboxylesterase
VAVLRVPGGELYYEAEGDGVAIVLVHGLALDARMWDDQVPALTDIARVVRYDVRGFGRSARTPTLRTRTPTISGGCSTTSRSTARCSWGFRWAAAS